MYFNFDAHFRQIAQIAFLGSWESKFRTDFDDYKPCWNEYGDTRECIEDVQFMQHNGQYRYLEQSFRGLSAQVQGFIDP